MPLDSNQIAALAERHVVIVPLIDLMFSSGTLRFALAQQNITIGSNTYIGIGPIASIGIRTESTDSLEGIELTASGLDASIVDIALTEPYQGRIMKLHKCFLDADTNAVIGTPTTAFIGRMIQMVLSEDNQSASIQIIAEHYDSDLERPTPVRINNAEQQRLYPGDKGAEWVESLIDRNVVWPTQESLRIH